MSRFIPAFHFVSPDKKLTPAWCDDVVNYCWYNSGNRHLLHDKNVREIDDYSSGNFDMKPFKRMFKSLKKALNSNTAQDGTVNETLAARADTTGVDWTPLPLIPTKLNSATAAVSKIPVEIMCRALDALAMRKKKDDITFLKNKPLVEADLQEIATQLGVGRVDIGSTKHSFGKFSTSPLGLNLSDPDEEDLFSNLIYSLRVETAFEKALQQFYSVKKMTNTKLLEIIDQFKYGVSVHTAYTSSMTGLPDAEYEFPGSVFTPESPLPDFSDNTHRITDKYVTVMDMFNYFSGEIKDEQSLYDLVLGDKGYCACNQFNKINKNDFGTYKVNLKYIEVKTVDWIGIARKKNSRRETQYFTMDESKVTEKIWAQNTYGFWWLYGTKHYFGMHKLPFSYRTKGQESFQNFSTNIYKSQKKSAVELSIGENKKAQIAEIKLQHTILKSLPPGKYVDLRYMRSALESLQEADSTYTINDIITLALESNIMIGDTTGFEGKNDGQLKPFIEIAGGLKGADITGYLTVIAQASQNISSYTGINEQLTGQGVNPEGLVGLQKLLINSSLNSLYYCNEAVRIQAQALFNIWGSLLQGSIEQGGKVKKAIVDMIGTDDTELLDGLNEAPLHSLTIEVQVGQREEERQDYRNELDRLKKLGAISTSDEYVLSSVANAKERFKILAIKEKKFMAEQQKIRQEQYANQQALMQQQGQNAITEKQAASQGAIEKVYAQGDVQSSLMKLGGQLGLSKTQMDAIVKASLQKDRTDGQIEKSIKTIQAKANAEATAAL